jgi:hypothetical protein
VRAVGPAAGQWTLGCHFVWPLTGDEMWSVAP